MNDFDKNFNKGNPIRAIGAICSDLAKKTRIHPLPFHMGDPSTDQSKLVIDATINSIKTRVFGYAPNDGDEQQRDALAKLFNDQEDVKSSPVAFQSSDVTFTPGATIITASLLNILKTDTQIDEKTGKQTLEGSGVLLPKPGYGSYYTQAQIAGQPILEYSFKDDGLIDFEALSVQIEHYQTSQQKNVKLMVITYPNNPTGKTLNEREAQEIAKGVEMLSTKFPHLYFYNDAVYSGTILPQKGYHSFYKYLSPETKLKTCTGTAFAKMTSQAGERLGAFCTKNKELMLHFKNACALAVAGQNVHAIEGFVGALHNLIGSFRPAAFDEKRIIHKNANHYFERRAKILKTIEAINDTLRKNNNSLQNSNNTQIKATEPGGSMYLWTDLSALKGLKIPKVMVEEVGNETLETGEQVMKYFLNLHKIGLVPFSICHGEAFYDEPWKMTARFSCVGRNLEIFSELDNSLKGAVAALLGQDITQYQYNSVDKIIERSLDLSNTKRNDVFSNNWQEKIIANKTKEVEICVPK
jgi:aspartate/methionine/tyrosine aminotransferase